MIKYFCDRCEQEIKEVTVEGPKNPYAVPEKARYGFGVQLIVDGNKGSTVFVCENCKVELEDVVYKKAPAETGLWNGGQ